MTYKVLSLKYRPQRFDQLRGQEHVTRILQSALAADRVGHAYLLVGPRGVGKTTTARIFARALNCAARVGADDAARPGAAGEGETPTSQETVGFEPCGTCPSCVDIAAGSDLDVVEMDAASNNAVDDVRALREQVGYATVRSRYRIWIVDEVHMLSLPAFNAFLKTLEEPPAQVKFIFCTTEEHKLPDTFRSRCQRIELRPIPDAVIVERLSDLAAREQVTLKEGLAQAIAHGALGGLRDAESQLEQLLAAIGPERSLSLADLESLSGRASADLLARLVEAVDAGQAGGALDAVDACLAAGAKPGVLLDQWLDCLRVQMLAGARGLTPSSVSPSSVTPSSVTPSSVSPSSVSPSSVSPSSVSPSSVSPSSVTPGYAKPARAIDILLAKRMHLRAGAAGDLVLQVAAVELARLPDARDLDALLVALRDAGGKAGAEALGEAPPGAPHSYGSERNAPAPARSAPARESSSESRSQVDAAPGDPAAGDPAAGDPAAGDPAAGDPAAGDPATGNPAALEATAPGPAPAGNASSRAPDRVGAPIDAPLLMEHWDEIVRRAARRIPAVAQALAQGTVQSVRGGALRMALADGAAEARGTLMRREVQLAFGQVVREVLGSYLRLEVVEAPLGSHGAGHVGADMRVHPSIHRVTEATGGRLLNVERKPVRGGANESSETRRHRADGNGA